MKWLLRECSPHHYPRRWLFINCSILLWSAVLLIIIIYTPEIHNDDERTDIELNYLFYNFAACAVWLVEVGFNILDFKGYFDSSNQEASESSLLRPSHKAEKTRMEVAALWIEGVLAAVFFVDSTTVAFHLSREQIHRQAKGMAIDVSFNMACYAFLVYRIVVDWRRSRKNGAHAEDGAERPSDTASPPGELV